MNNFPLSLHPIFLPLTLVMFDPRKQTPNVHNHILDPVTTLNDSWEPHNFDFQVSQKQGNIQFRGGKMEDDDESGTSSPPLWRNYRSLSPNSRAQAIARGQWELMEMVKNMPESCFELSLKDLVEQPKSQVECLINTNKEKKQVVQQNRVNIKKNDQIRKAKMTMRINSVENGGVFLKMVSPVSLSSIKKKKHSSANTTRVSPKPEECENSSSKNLEKEWWKKRFSGSSSSSNSSGSTGRNSSRGSSTSSRHNSNRKREGLLSSCWSSFCLSENNKVTTDALDW